MRARVVAVVAVVVAVAAVSLAAWVRTLPNVPAQLLTGYGTDLPAGLLAVAWTATGAVLLVLRPRNALGWLLVVVGVRGDRDDRGGRRDLGQLEARAKPGEATDGEESADDLVEEGDAEAALEPTTERIDECTTAAGLTAEDATEPVPGELKGLQNAISRVLWSCIHNDNDGLVNALEHLSANFERKELRDEAKEERKAEREAAKAERRSEHEAAKAARELVRAS